jgi:hypothetical protein
MKTRRALSLPFALAAERRLLIASDGAWQCRHKTKSKHELKIRYAIDCPA